MNPEDFLPPADFISISLKGSVGIPKILNSENIKGSLLKRLNKSPKKPGQDLHDRVLGRELHKSSKNLASPIQLDSKGRPGFLWDLLLYCEER